MSGRSVEERLEIDALLGDEFAKRTIDERRRHTIDELDFEIA